jgi:hypothetical protein
VSTEVTSKDAEASSWFQPRARAAPEVTAAGNPAAGHPAPPAGHPAPPAGYRNGSDGQGNSSAARNGHGFADSQHDGLNAMIGIATAVSPAPDAAVRTSAPRTSAPRVITLATPVLERVAETAPQERMPARESRHSRVHGRPSRAPAWRRLPWPLLAILAVQVVMAVRLIWSNTAFTDEATYLYAGSQELSHWLSRTPVADYQSVLPGSPALYPPLGDLANTLGGLAAARILSLAFVLGTSGLLYATGHRLFGKAAAVLGTALFAALAVTQYLSALATYDAMALFLLALAAYLTVGRRDDGSLAAATLSCVAAPVVLALANATSYATLLWDPFIIGLVCCAPGLAGDGWRSGRARALRFTMVLAAVLAIGLAMGKAKYLQGIVVTLHPQAGAGQPAAFALSAIWHWAGPVFAIAAAGLLVLLLSRSRPMPALGALLLLAAIAIPLSQALTGTTASLQDHVAYGAWFGSVLAGFALARILRFWPLIAIAGVALILALPAAYARPANSLYHTWAAENPAFITTLRSLVHPGNQRYLIEGDAGIPAYYVGPRVTSLQWKQAGDYTYTDGATGRTYQNGPALAQAVQHRVFALIILNFTHASAAEPAADFAVLAAIQKYGGYHVSRYLPPSTAGSESPYTVWQVNSAARARA